MHRLIKQSTAAREMMVKRYQFRCSGCGTLHIKKPKQCAVCHMVYEPETTGHESSAAPDSGAA